MMEKNIATIQAMCVPLCTEALQNQKLPLACCSGITMLVEQSTIDEISACYFRNPSI